MWILTNIATGNVLIVIKEKPKYTVGRAGADLAIIDDSSVSRTHAFLHITANQINATADASATSQVRELLELEDAGSKYGTFHNDGINRNAGIAKETKIPLADGDRIRFGVLKSVWVVSNIAPIVATSVLPSEHTQLLRQYMDVLGGCILGGGWNEKYTHLTLAEINMTSKLLHALLDQKPIVTCDYWCNVIQAARRGKRMMPQVSAYVPPNPHNFVLTYNAKRQQLFKDLTFVFLHAQHFKTYAPIVEKAGGKSKHLNEGVQKSFLVREDVVVIQYVPSTESQSTQTIGTIEDCLKLQSRRTVPEFEIGLAIIHCSIEKYCNPSYNPDDNFELQASESCRPVSSILTDDETEVFIPETDRKSTASNNLSGKSHSDRTTGSIESRVEPTDTVTIESQAFEHQEKDSGDVTMSSLQVTESVQEANKRKRIHTSEAIPETHDSHMNSDDEDIFNFAAKKAHLDDKPKSAVQSESPTTSSAAAGAKETPKSGYKQLPIEIKKRAGKRTIDMSGFLEKSQAPIPSGDADAVDKNGTNENGNQGIKRARIAVIDNDNDDDLFCFGGNKNNDESSNAKRARSDGNESNEEDLFNFGGGGADNNVDGAEAHNHSNNVIDADATTKNKHSRIIMPKPKQLPAKICITAWLDCSLSALKIKAEEVKQEVNQEVEEKTENNESGVEGVEQQQQQQDSKELIEPIKGGCVVTMLSTKSLLHDREISNNGSGITARVEQANDKLNGCIKNFKKFTKKFQPQTHRVIRAVSSTVCGAMV